MKGRIGLWSLFLTAWGFGANADAVTDWIDAQPEAYRAILHAGQTEAPFSDYNAGCPADVFPKSARVSEPSQECSDRPGWCMIQCRAGSAQACFGIARAIELDLADTGEATFKFPFFMASCAAGLANGCVNAGATAKNGDWMAGTEPRIAQLQTCQFRTYRAACDAAAPWGCFMLGLEWAFEGVNGDTNIEKARSAWQRACNIDAESDACGASRARLDVVAE